MVMMASRSNRKKPGKEQESERQWEEWKGSVATVYVPKQKKITSSMSGFQELTVSEEYRNKFGWFRVEFGPLPSRFKLQVDLFIMRHRNVETHVREFLDRYCHGKECTLRNALQKMVLLLSMRAKKKRSELLCKFCETHLVRYAQEKKSVQAYQFHRRWVLRQVFEKLLIPSKLAHEKEFNRKMHRRHLLAQQMDRGRLVRLAFSLWRQELIEKRRTLLSLSRSETLEHTGKHRTRRGDGGDKSTKKRKRGGCGGGKGRKTKKKPLRHVTEELERWKQRIEILTWSFRRLKEFTVQRKRVRKLLTRRGIQILSLSSASLIPSSVTDLDLSKRICICIVEMCYFLKISFFKIEQLRSNIQVPGSARKRSIGTGLGSVLGSCVYALSFFCRRKINEMTSCDARNCLTSDLWVPVFQNVIDVLRNFVKQGNRFEKQYCTLARWQSFCMNPLLRFMLFFHRQAREIALRALGLFLRSLQDIFLEGHFSRTKASHIERSKRSQILILHLAMESSFDFFVNQSPMDCQCYIARFHESLPSEFFGTRFGEVERTFFLSLLPSISLYGHVSPPSES